jgi:hypothetical protein
LTEAKIIASAVSTKAPGASENPTHKAAFGKTENMTQSEGAKAASFNMRRQINSTTYEVEVYFNPESHETLDEKILRLIRNEAGRE